MSSRARFGAAGGQFDPNHIKQRICTMNSSKQPLGPDDQHDPVQVIIRLVDDETPLASCIDRKIRMLVNVRRSACILEPTERIMVA